MCIRDSCGPSYVCTTAKNLTLKEYHEIKKTLFLPDLPKEAYQISYLFDYHPFLPDYQLDIEYKVPIDVEIELIEEMTTVLTTSRTFEIIENVKKVTYSEFRT